MWAGEESHRYLSQQPCILTSKLCVVSVSFNFRAVSVRPFLTLLFLLAALFISWCFSSSYFCISLVLSFSFLNFPILKFIWVELLMWQMLNNFTMYHMATVGLDDSLIHSYL